MVEIANSVIQLRLTMKTATVRELRNNFAGLAKWIEQGEEITMARNGQTFAALSAACSEQGAKVDWAARFAKRKPLGKGMSTAATEKLWSDLRD
jgi:antitoxin (DNA-binding transcriptional repressor) of toxin-antitoxin stability system